jgi:hypothetical protein
LPPRPNAFLDTIVAFLLPYFSDAAANSADVRAEIIETLAAYATRTGAEALKAAQIIAFSMSTLDTLAEAKSTALTPSQRIRFRGCANSLNRSALRHQDALDRRQNDNAPHARPPTLDNRSDTNAQHAIGQTQAAIETARNRVSGARPATAAPAVPRTQQDKRIWASAMTETMAQMGFPNGLAQAG